MEVPVVDFEQLKNNEEEELKKLREACERCGCFRIINHTVPETLMADMKLVAKYLHDELPEEIKKVNNSVFHGTGYLASLEISPFYDSLGLYDIQKKPQALEDFFNQLGVTPKQRCTHEHIETHKSFPLEGVIN
ncbi:hypothetical protein PIB30_065307 [Stylosanthes scabra]|uniref:Non-haem dioxygenase N-terminal domain-containing protein n=1 Tax=Stylosanthes scabra TaxID=79078 RepID=A0ABU6VKG4_9FABA|nr:hypothetical protein [Stylosanthes scabra]